LITIDVRIHRLIGLNILPIIAVQNKWNPLERALISLSFSPNRGFFENQVHRSRRDRCGGETFILDESEHL